MCIVPGLYETHTRTLVPATIAYDTCSEYKVVSPSAAPPDYCNYFIPSVLLPRLAGGREKPLQLAGLVKLLVGLGNTFFRILFVIAERLEVPQVLCTASAYEHVRVHQVQARTLEFAKRSAGGEGGKGASEE